MNVEVVMIVCWSVKGGNGTTVVAAALALVLAQQHEAGARAASISPDSPDVVQQAVAAEVRLRPLHLQIVRDGDLITVEAKYPRTFDLWLISGIAPPLTLSATVTMHVQDVG